MHLLRQRDFQLRLLIGILVLAGALYCTSFFPYTDAMQDYAAAWGHWHGYSSNDSTPKLMALCCSDFYPPDRIPQTAHPPLATVLFLPLALLSWKQAQLVWLLLSWLIMIWGWQALKIPPLSCLLTATFWLVVLILGGLEAAMFGLVALSLLWKDRSELGSGVAIGLAAALKLYPVLFIFGMWVAGRRRAAVAAAAAGALATMLSELVLGLGTTAGWLAYTPQNTLVQVRDIRNLSVVRILWTVLPSLSPMLTSLAVITIFIALTYGAIRRSEGVRPLIPTMLAGASICWEQYLVLLALNPIGKIEQICLAISSIIISLVWLQVIPSDNLAPIGYGPLFLVLLLSWYRQRQASMAGAVVASKL
ncbi:DUF2029 domain-containing protein [Chloroflexia bacterium SDU3-3]|nr:DUF2029 domain-containing protein [Chloroflexia bacterium SDU3-3]